jgi:hypothetical protein
MRVNHHAASPPVSGPVTPMTGLPIDERSTMGDRSRNAVACTRRRAG